MDFAVIKEGYGHKKNVEGVLYTTMEDGGDTKKNAEGILYSTRYLPERGAHPECQEVFCPLLPTTFLHFSSPLE